MTLPNCYRCGKQPCECKRLTVGSLFAGIGGLELGLEMTGGFKTVWQVENNEFARRVLAKHWPDARRWDDVRTFPPDAAGNGWEQGDQNTSGRSGGSGEKQGAGPRGGGAWDCDLICAGFPCQDISYAGAGAGLGGERSGLFYEATRIIRVLGPRYVVLENVAALLTRGLDAVLGTLASLGYDAEWHCIPAAAVGAPHIRDRVFVIAYANGCEQGRGQQSERQANQRDTDATGDGPQGNVDVPDAKSVGRTTGRGESRNETGKGQRWSESSASSWWNSEPAIRFVDDGLPLGLVRYAGRVATGVPNRVNKLRCLGNAVVPQVAQWIGQRILEAERTRH